MLLVKNMSKPIFIGVAGNIGAGKTTLTEKLSDAIQFQPENRLIQGYL